MKKLDRKNIKDILALTPMQEGMLFHYLKAPRSRKHFEQLYLVISGNLERTRFEKAWNHVIAANEMLRTVFRWEGLNNPAQLVLKEHKIEPRYFDLSGEKEEKKNTLIEKIKVEDRDRPFDLQEVPFRVTLINLGEKKYGVIVSNHHILYDGWSNGIILKEFFKIYNELSIGRVPVMPVKTGFREFIRWSRNRDRRQEEEFWKEYLDGFESKDRGLVMRRREVSGTAAFVFEFPVETVTKLDHFTKAHKISRAVLLYTAWGIVLQKYHNAVDMLFDVTVSGRSAKVKGIEHMVGLFINTLPVRIRRRSGEPVIDLLARVEEAQRKWEAFENTSALTLKEHLDNCHNHVLFDSVVVIENYPLDIAEVQNSGEFSIDHFSNTGMTGYDLTLLITVSGPIKVEFSYDTGLFDSRTAALVGRHFISILDEIVTSPDKSVGGIDIPSGEQNEITRVLKNSRETERVTETGFTAPRNKVEERLAAIWWDVLSGHRQSPQFTQIGIDDNFFDFGGHSLRASLLAAKLQREFNIKIPLAEIFRRPTIREMALYIKGAFEDIHTPLKPAEKSEYYPLSSAQKRMAALQLIDPGSTAYNVTSAVEVEGPLDTDRLAVVFRQLIARHDVFRTFFRDINGELFQGVLADVEDVAFEIESAEPGHKDFVRPFDLSRAPLLRAGLIKTGEERHLLVMDMHHLITDGISMGLFIKEFSAFYKREQLPPPEYRYRDFCLWQVRRLNSGELKSREKYWLDHLSGELPVLNLLTDFPRPSIQSFAGDRLVFRLEEECIRQLRRLIRRTGTTLFMVFLSALNILLSRYTSREDIIVGTTVAGRNHIDLQNIVGLFIETLALRNKPAGDKPFLTFLEEVKENTLNAFENQSYPFRELIEKVGGTAPNRIGRNPLFDVMLIVQNVDMAPLEIEGLTVTPVDFRSTDSKVDFTVEVFEDGAGIRFNLEYCTALFRKDTMQRLGGHLINVLKETAGRTDVYLRDIGMLSDRERDRFEDEFSGKKNGVTANTGLSVHRLFEEQAARTPFNIAVVYEDKRLTYRKLNERANELSEIIKGL